MKAVLLHGARRLEVTDVPKPHPPNGWALVRSELVGICGTDKAFYTGSYPLFKNPLIPGHEVVGVVVEGPDNLIGSRVVSEINFPCWRCDYCRSGLYTHCPSKKTLGIDFDGGMAEYFIAPIDALHVFNGPIEAGIFVEPLAAVLRMFSIEPPKPGYKIGVIGTGNLSLLILQVLKRMYGARVDLIARRNSRKAEVLRALVDEIVYLDEVKSSSYDVVIDASGDPGALELAVEIVRPTGTIHLKSTPGLPTTIPATKLVVKESRVIGSRCGSFREFREAIRVLENRTIEYKLDKVYDIDDAKDAFEESLSGRYFKVAIRP